MSERSAYVWKQAALPSETKGRCAVRLGRRPCVSVLAEARHAMRPDHSAGAEIPDLLPVGCSRP